MRLRSGQSRFLAGTLAAWVVVRVVLPSIGAEAASDPAARPTLSTPESGPDLTTALHRPDLANPAISFGASIRQVSLASVHRPNARLLRSIRTNNASISVDAARNAPGKPAPAEALGREHGDAAPFVSPVVTARLRSSRWAADAYLFVRPGSGQASLAADGALGGSQAAARVTYQLNASGPVRTAIAARLYAPLASKGAEAALGLDWHPLPGVPLRFSVERRFDLDGAGRHAWSAYGAGGFYMERFDGRLALDGYGQAGVVGIERRDLFVDGALRAGRRYHVERATVTIGAGLWGAAQPGVSRLDIGPRLAGVLPIATHDITVALEGRLRVAGRASPGSGAALTFGVDL